MVALLVLSLYCHVSVFIICLFLMMAMRESGKFCQRESNSGKFFFSYERSKKESKYRYYKRTIIGPQAK